MGFDIDRLLRLWSEPVPAGAAAEAAFGALYTDPTVINGAPVDIPQLVAMARTTQETFRDAEREVLDVVTGEAGSKVAVAFALRARRDGQPVELRVIDILTITDGRISAAWAVSQPVTPD